jgi:lipopolysaccharide transport system ATP-binding protein
MRVFGSNTGDHHNFLVRRSNQNNMTTSAIRVENLSKQYKLGAEKVSYDTLRDQIVSGARSLFQKNGHARRDAEAFWALKEVSLQIPRGATVGIIGRNGAGKSTLLKILSRITEPTSGFAEIHGRLSSLLEVGTGFHGELTGRENIYLNGAILGMRRAEIVRKFDEIVAFAEVEKFIDTAVKHYSSGMYVRLAFAVAAHLEPEILLVDEVLAVGDTAFQRKCLGKMGDAAREGRTILFVSHNMAAVEGLCSVAYLFEHGRMARMGPTTAVIDSYLAALPASSATPLDQRMDRQGDGRLRFTDIELLLEHNTSVEVVQSGRDVEFSVGYSSVDANLKNVQMSVDIYAASGQCMLILNTEMVGADFESVPSRGRFSCRVARFPLAPGQYFVTLFCMVNGIIADWVQQAMLLTVEAGDFFGTGRLPPSTHGGFLTLQDWHVEMADPALDKRL